jgi:hypothetical protein
MLMGKTNLDQQHQTLWCLSTISSSCVIWQPAHYITVHAPLHVTGKPAEARLVVVK